MPSKRASIEIEFNWIFVLIAGTFIFLFFFSIIQFARKSSEESTAVTISNNLDAIFTGASTADNTVYPFTIPNKVVHFTCDAYRIGESQNEKVIRNKIIIAPSYIKGGRMMTWSKSWDAPFRVTNLLFVSSPQIRYIFIGDSFDSIYQYFEDNIPLEFNAEFYDLADSPSIEDNNNFKVRFIYVGAPPQQAHAQIFNSMIGEDVTALSIIPSGDSIAIAFFMKSPPTGKAGTNFNEIYYSPEIIFSDYVSLLAAAISENPEDFECNMKNAFRRFVPIAEIYKARSQELAQEYDSEDNIACANVHTQAISVLDNMIAGTQAVPAYFGTQSLKNLNEAAQQNSCALIY